MLVKHQALSAILLLGLAGSLASGAAQETAPGSGGSGAASEADHRTHTDEDWTSLPLAGSHLQAEPPLLAERDEEPTFTREMIEVRWRAGDPIHLFLILPKGTPKPPVVLYLYSFPSETDRFLNDDFCALLAQDGYAAAGFVSALTGQRYHDRPMKEWFISELQEALGSSVHDVEMMLNYLAGRGDLDTARVGMFGEGSGAAIAILAAAADSRIKAVDLVDPWGDWPVWMSQSSLVPEEERGDYVKPEFLKKLAPLEPVSWFGRVKAAVRLQYLSEPGVTPASARERITAAAPPQAKVIAHGAAVAQYQAAKLKFFDWVKEQLRPAPVR